MMSRNRQVLLEITNLLIPVIHISTWQKSAFRNCFAIIANSALTLLAIYFFILLKQMP